MKPLQPQTEIREFCIWEYQVSHAKLLIRSPKSPAVNQVPERLTNVDLLCEGVEYVALPTRLKGFELVAPNAEELRHLESTLSKNLDIANVRILQSANCRFSIVASKFSIIENDWDIFESPIEFRSQYRG